MKSMIIYASVEVLLPRQDLVAIQSFRRTSYKISFKNKLIKGPKVAVNIKVSDIVL